MRVRGDFQTGVVHPHIQPPERIERGLHQPGRARFFLHIALNGHAFRARRLNLRHHVLRTLRVAVVVHYYIRALLRKPQCNRRADAFGRTGYHNGSALQIGIHCLNSC